MGDLLRQVKNDGASRKAVAEGDREWREQYEAEKPVATEGDALLAAWLGLQVSLLPADAESSIIGGKLDRLTHLMVDEAQDISYTHAQILRQILVSDGTLTLVGDLRQRLGLSGGITQWSALAIPELKPHAFKVNHRQSLELGTFVACLHKELYGDMPVWRPAAVRSGPLPRVQVEASREDMPLTVAEEIRWWRTEVRRATVGIIYDSRWPSESLRRFCSKLEEELADQDLAVFLIGKKTRGAHLRRMDCVLVASANATKGLEFDVVIFVDPNREWGEKSVGLNVRQRNGLYVAASRAKQGLSFVLPALPPALQSLIEQGKCHRVRE